MQARFIRVTIMSATETGLDPELCQVLRSVMDPEIGLNIVDLGLVVEARRSPDAIGVKLTLTS